MVLLPEGNPRSFLQILYRRMYRPDAFDYDVDQGKSRSQQIKDPFDAHLHHLTSVFAL